LEEIISSVKGRFDNNQQPCDFSNYSSGSKKMDETSEGRGIHSIEENPEPTKWFPVSATNGIENNTYPKVKFPEP